MMGLVRSRVASIPTGRARGDGGGEGGGTGGVLRVWEP